MLGRDLFHMVKFFLGIDEPNTQTTKKERETINKYASNKTLAMEIGVFEGVNTVAIASSISANGKLYAIDPFFTGSLGMSYSKQVAVGLLKKNKVLNKVKLIEKLSFNAIDDVPDNIEMMFIDGDHSYEGIEKDWNGFAPKIAKGGFILLHDTTVPDFDPDRAALGSIRYFDDVIAKDKNFVLLETVDSLNVLQRI